MTQETTFEIDGIQYTHPYFSYNMDSVYVRPLMQIFEGDARLCPMRVKDNIPKNGLMDSDVDDSFVTAYWGMW